MNAAPKSRLLLLAGGLTLIITVACADSSTAPATPGARAGRDSTQEIEGDTLLCKNGWVIEMGRYVCTGNGG